MVTSLVTHEKMPDFSGSVAANARLTANVPVGRSIHYFQLACKTGAGAALTEAQMKADIDEITVKINGDIIFQGTATLLLDIFNTYYGANIGNVVEAGIIEIPFDRINLAADRTQNVFKLGTANVKTVTVEVKLAGTVSNLASIDLYAGRSENEPLGLFVTLKKFSYSFAATGVQEISDLPRNPINKLMALHITNGSNPGVIDDVEFRINNQTVYEADQSQNDHNLQRAGRSPVSGYYHLDMIRQNSIRNVLPFQQVQDMRLMIDWSTAPTTFEIYKETIEGVAASAV
jgi:hypothetical protein